MSWRTPERTAGISCDAPASPTNALICKAAKESSADSSFAA